MKKLTPALLGLMLLFSCNVFLSKSSEENVRPTEPYQLTIHQNKNQSTRCAIRGIVRDMESKEAIPGCDLRLLDESRSVVNGAITDSLGSFRIDAPPGRFQVRFSKPDYAPLTVAIGQNIRPGDEVIIQVYLDQPILYNKPGPKP